MGVGLESLTIGNRNCSREEKSWASHKLLPSYKTLFVRGRNLALTAVYKCTRDTFYLSPRAFCMPAAMPFMVMMRVSLTAAW